MPRKLFLHALLFLSIVSLASGQSVRHFIFHYAFTVKNVPAGQRTRIWFPAAHSDDYQEIRVVAATGDLPLKKTRESRFGNELYYAESSKAKGGDLRLEITYDVVRHEHVTLGSQRPRLENASLQPKQRSEFLGPDKLVPITGLPAQLAAHTTAGETTELRKARAIYDYVFANMRYDKTVSGWVRGYV